MEESIWEKSKKRREKYISTTYAIDVIRREAKAMEDGCENIKVRFTKMNVPAGIGILTEYASVISSDASIMKVTQDDVDSNLKDINGQIKRHTYGFTVFSNEYRFLVFRAEMSMYYPISFYPDEDIYKEIESRFNEKNSLNKSESKGKVIIVKNPDQLNSFLEAVFETRKLQAVLQALSKNK